MQVLQPQLPRVQPAAAEELYLLCLCGLSRAAEGQTGSRCCKYRPCPKKPPKNNLHLYSALIYRELSKALEDTWQIPATLNQ